MTSANCRRCSEILNHNANFCWSCGASQQSSLSPETIAVPVVAASERAHPEATSAPTDCSGDTLVLATGVFAGDRFALRNDVSTVGRHSLSDVFLDDVSVSRHHAIFTRTASGRVTVRDLNSLNGTYVNAARVEEATLKNADELQIGKFKLIFWGRSE